MHALLFTKTAPLKTAAMPTTACSVCCAVADLRQFKEELNSSMCLQVLGEEPVLAVGHRYKSCRTDVHEDKTGPYGNQVAHGRSVLQARFLLLFVWHTFSV